MIPSTIGSLLYWVCWPVLAGCAVTAGAQAWRLVAPARAFLKRRSWSRDEALRLMFLTGLLFGLVFSFPYALERQSDFRLLWDEAVVHSTSLAMHRHRSAEMPLMTLPKPGGIEPVAVAVDKRPPLFPFLVSLVHAARGPAEDNGQRLNKGLRQLLLLGLGVAMVAAGVPLAAVAASLTLVMALPILSWASSSGGIDLLAACCVLWFLRLFSGAWEKRDLGGFLLCLAPAAAAAYSRYEIIAIVLPALAALLWRLKRKFLAEAAAAFACLLVLLVPLVALLLGARASFVEAGGGPLFSFSHLLGNLRGFAGAPDPFLAKASLGLLALLAFSLWKKRPPGAFAMALACAALFQLVLVLLYFAGHPLHVASARLYLLPALALMLVPALVPWPAVRITKKWAYSDALPLLGPLVVLALALSLKWSAGQQRPGELFPLSPEQRVRARLDPSPELAKLKGYLVISSLHFYLVGRGQPSVSPKYFLEHQREITGPVHWLRTPVDDPYGLGAAEIQALEKLRWLPVPASPPEVNLYRLRH